MELEKVRALELRRSWMTVNEVRQRESLEWILGGDVVLGLSKLHGTGFSNINSVITRRKLK